MGKFQVEKVFCDLDGTLLDVSSRHHKVYSELIVQYGGTPLAKDDYWRLKRGKVKWPQLLEMSGVSPQELNSFLNDFIIKIEDPAYLKTDTIFPGAQSTLEYLSKKYDCYLVSLRRKPDNLIWQLQHLNINRYFKDILTGHSETDGYDVKIKLIKDVLQDSSGAIIGDTEADVVTGKQLGLTSIAVLSGIRDREFLSSIEPDYLLESVQEVQTIL